MYAPDNMRFELFEYSDCTNPPMGHEPEDAVFDWRGFREWDKDWNYSAYKTWTI